MDTSLAKKTTGGFDSHSIHMIREIAFTNIDLFVVEGQTYEVHWRTGVREPDSQLDWNCIDKVFLEGEEFLLPDIYVGERMERMPIRDALFIEVYKLAPARRKEFLETKPFDKWQD